MATLPPLAPLIGSARASHAPAGAGPAKTDTTATKQTEVLRQFESFILQSFIENMLPKNAESVFGSGTAGGIWKSMMAEKLADQISRGGGIGIAKQLGGQHVSTSPLTQERGGAETAQAADPTPMVRSFRIGDPS